MVYKYWTKEEDDIIREKYPYIEDAKLLVNFLPNRSFSQIKGRAKTLQVKRIFSKSPRKTNELLNNDNMCCSICKEIKPYPYEFNHANKTLKTVINLTCNTCHNAKVIVKNYFRKYGITLDVQKLHETYSIVQWWKWTYNEETPNGKLLRFIPRELHSKENIAVLGRYVINEVMKLKSKEDILSLSQKTMEKYKIAFSRTPFILNSPSNLIRLSFPELEFKNWEMEHSGNNFWKDYSNFLDGVKYYYYEVYQMKFKDICLSKVFSYSFVEKEFYKLHRAKEMYYSHLSWKEIMSDIDSNIIVPKTNKEAFDGTILESKEEKEVYEFIKLSKFGDNLMNIPLNTREYKFYDSVNECNYIPDFILLGEKPTIIEYFGGYSEDDEFFKGYNQKTKNKIEYYSNLKKFNFLALYPVDLKNNCRTIKEKLTTIA